MRKNRGKDRRLITYENICRRVRNSGLRGTDPSLWRRLPGHLDPDRDLVLHGHGEERGRIDFEIGERGGNSSGEVRFISLLCELKDDLLIVSILSSELNFKIGMDGGGVGSRFGQAGANGDHRKFGTPRDLNHVEVAIAI